MKELDKVLGSVERLHTTVEKDISSLNNLVNYMLLPIAVIVGLIFIFT